MEDSVFDAVAVILPGLVPDELGEIRVQPRRWGIKAWFGPARPTRDHYEAQVMGPENDSTAKVLILEVGFHAEHAKEAENDAVLERLVATRATWADTVGDEAVAGDFLGGSTRWRRISETWPDPNLSDPDLAFEIAARLADYVIALEPARRSIEKAPAARR